MTYVKRLTKQVMAQLCTEFTRPQAGGCAACSVWTFLGLPANLFLLVLALTAKFIRLIWLFVLCFLIFVQCDHNFVKRIAGITCSMSNEILAALAQCYSPRNTGLAWYWRPWEVTARSIEEYRHEVRIDGTQTSRGRLHGNKLTQTRIGSVYVAHPNNKYKNVKNNELTEPLKRELQAWAGCNPRIPSWQLGTVSVVTISIF